VTSRPPDSTKGENVPRRILPVGFSVDWNFTTDGNLAELTCYYCFARFAPHELAFKCHHHGSKPRVFRQFPDVSRNGSEPIRTRWAKRLMRKPPRQAKCDDDRRLSAYRVCPECEKDLPHFLGRRRQQIIAVTGCRASGKTVYHTSLLHQLRNVHSRDPSPFAVSMFEDDRSFSIYQKFHRQIFHRLRLPKWTQVQREIEPIIVRLTGRHLQGRQANLVFYDHAGELVEALEKTRYLRYLAGAAAILYVVDPDGDAELAAEGLNAVARRIRDELGIDENKKINKPLAVVLNMADRKIFPALLQKHDRSLVMPGVDQPAQFWKRWGAAEKKLLNDSSRLYWNLAHEEYALQNLANSARDHFRVSQFFGISSLGQEPGGGRLTPPVTPAAVEVPFFWALQTLASS